jgi:hypothetical protein
MHARRLGCDREAMVFDCGHRCLVAIGNLAAEEDDRKANAESH